MCDGYPFGYVCHGYPFGYSIHGEQPPRVGLDYRIDRRLFPQMKKTIFKGKMKLRSGKILPGPEGFSPLWWNCYNHKPWMDSIYQCTPKTPHTCCLNMFVKGFLPFGIRKQKPVFYYNIENIKIILNPNNYGCIYDKFHQYGYTVYDIIPFISSRPSRPGGPFIPRPDFIPNISERRPEIQFHP